MRSKRVALSVLSVLGAAALAAPPAVAASGDPAARMAATYGFTGPVGIPTVLKPSGSSGITGVAHVREGRGRLRLHVVLTTPSGASDVGQRLQFQFAAGRCGQEPGRTFTAGEVSTAPGAPLDFTVTANTPVRRARGAITGWASSFGTGWDPDNDGLFTDAACGRVRPWKEDICGHGSHFRGCRRSSIADLNSLGGSGVGGLLVAEEVRRRLRVHVVVACSLLTCPSPGGQPPDILYARGGCGRQAGRTMRLGDTATHEVGHYRFYSTRTSVTRPSDAITRWARSVRIEWDLDNDGVREEVACGRERGFYSFMDYVDDL